MKNIGKKIVQVLCLAAAFVASAQALEPPGAQLVVANIDKAVRPPNRYVLATFTEDIDASNLAVSAETLVNLPPRWQISVETRRIMLRYPMGATLNFR